MSNSGQLVGAQIIGNVARYSSAAAVVAEAKKVKPPSVLTLTRVARKPD